MNKLKELKGSALLLITTIIWGIAFVVQSTASDSIGSFTFNAIRSAMAAALLFIVIVIKVIVNKEKAKKSNADVTPLPVKKSIMAGAICGIALFGAVNFQQFGIAAYPEGVASSGRAGFITSTYVIFVALFCLIKNRKISVNSIIATLVCIAGMYCLCLAGGIDKLYLGDLLVLCAALCLAIHIMLIDRFRETDGLITSCVQFVVCGAISAVCMLIFEKPEIAPLRDGWLLLLYAGVLSSGVGYTLQVIGQKYARPQTASIIMSLESVFAALAGWIILKEKSGAVELVGCALVFISVIVAQLPELDFSKLKRKPKNEV